MERPVCIRERNGRKIIECHPISQESMEKGYDMLTSLYDNKLITRGQYLREVAHLQERGFILPEDADPTTKENLETISRLSKVSPEHKEKVRAEKLELQIEKYDIAMAVLSRQQETLKRISSYNRAA